MLRSCDVSELDESPEEAVRQVIANGRIDGAPDPTPEEYEQLLAVARGAMTADEALATVITEHQWATIRRRAQDEPAVRELLVLLAGYRLDSRSGMAALAALRRDGPPDPDRLRPPEPGTGVRQEIDAYAQAHDHGWIHERFLTGSHAGDIRCRSCMAGLDLDYEQGVWTGEHDRRCPVAAETPPWQR
jgi:hypothetical protein